MTRKGRTDTRQLVVPRPGSRHRVETAIEQAKQADCIYCGRPCRWGHRCPEDQSSPPVLLGPGGMYRYGYMPKLASGRSRTSALQVGLVERHRDCHGDATAELGEAGSTPAPADASFPSPRGHRLLTRAVSAFLRLLERT